VQNWKFAFLRRCSALCRVALISLPLAKDKKQIITVWLQPTQKKGATLITLSEKSGYCTQTCTVAAVRGI